MKKYGCRVNRILCMVFVLCVIFCSCDKTDKKDLNNTTLKIGTENITGNFNPFFASSEGDKRVVSQVYQKIQRTGSNNKLINDAGSITYELLNDNKVKYTVTIKDNLHFSDGSNVTIDDIIFFYYLISDASYDGVYSDFYLNDIEGLKEFYFDSKTYSTDIALLDGKDINEYIKENYSDGADVTEISGIKRVDDYTCTILYNSRNINAVSNINAVIVSKDFFSADYVKGGAEKLKSISTSSMGSGPYYVSSYDVDDRDTKLLYNTYNNEIPAFKKLEFTDIIFKGIDVAQAIKKGNLDVASTVATSDIINSIYGASVKYYFLNKAEYVSVFINKKIIPDVTDRKQMMILCNDYSVPDSKFGSYYTKITSPLSIRFEEYPVDVTPYFTGVSIPQLIKSSINSINVYTIGDENSAEYALAENIVKIINEIGVKATLVKSTYSQLKNDALSGKAGMWVLAVADGATCDKYDYFNSSGKNNLTGLSNETVDTLTEQIRKAVGFTDRADLTSQLLASVMGEAVEMPVYQLQTIVMFNTNTINPDSVNDISLADGYDNVIPVLY